MIDYIDIIRVILTSFIITLILGPIIIPMLRRLNIGQNVRDDGPETHLIKSGTPTMGGNNDVGGITYNHHDFRYVK